MDRKQIIRRFAVAGLCVLTMFSAANAAETPCEHTYVEVIRPGTCTNPGSRYYECSKCGDQYGHESIPALGHDLGEWTTAEEADCTHPGRQERSCSRCDYREQQEIPARGHTFRTEKVEPTCEKDGYTRKICTVCGHEEKTDPVPALGHEFVVEKVERTCTRDGYTKKTCTVCGKEEKTDIVPATGHEFVTEKVAPTCEKDGYTKKTCTVCGKEEKTDIVPATGHEFVTEKLEPTCEKDGYTKKTCTVCGKEEKTDIVPATGHEFVTEKVEPTCEKDGYTRKLCTVCGKEEQTDLVPATGHDFLTETVEATCEKDGYTRKVCRTCGHEEKTDIVLAKGHSWTEETEPPTCTKEGLRSRVCSVCGKKEKQEVLPALGHSYDEGVVTREPTATAMGTVLYTCQRCGHTYTEKLPRRDNPFVDVCRNDYYYEPVLWAVEAGITSGTDDTHFSPDQVCTRGQVVTFLWRAVGAPEPDRTANPFRDISRQDYYFDAVLWAVQNGVTAGIAPDRFGPEQGCTRAQVVTFFHRAKGSPVCTETDRFQDVKEEDYFFLPVCWAAESGITAGVDQTHFAPGQVCTRGQIVTFLYRDQEKQPNER